MSEILPVHGGQLRQIADQFGISSELLDFSANINPDGPPEGVPSLLRASLDDPSTLMNYPDLNETKLKHSLAGYIGVPSENIIVGNGFVPLLDTVLRTSGIRSCLLPVPAFVEYRKSLERAQIEITPHILPCTAEFRYDIEAMLRGPQEAILLANPQNPSGVLSNPEVLLQLTSEAAARNKHVLLDEAFIDYCPDSSLAQETLRHSNLIVFRSLTKFFGMPGLRIAYAVTNAKMARSLNEATPPWPVTTLASLAADIAVEDKSYINRTMTLNKDRRTRLQESLRALGIQVYPSAANFLLLRLPEKIDTNIFWKRMILDHGIVVRNCGNYEALPDRHLRVAVRKESENDRLVEAIRQLLA